MASEVLKRLREQVLHGIELYDSDYGVLPEEERAEELVDELILTAIRLGERRQRDREKHEQG